jgi:hypothetical protein
MEPADGANPEFTNNIINERSGFPIKPGKTGLQNHSLPDSPVSRGLIGPAHPFTGGLVSVEKEVWL